MNSVRTFSRWLALAALCGWHAGAQTPQTPQRLSIAEALRLAQAHSPTQAQAAARVYGANARLRSAAASPSPVLSIGPHVGNSAAGTDEDLLLTQTIELGDKRRQRVRAAQAERDSVVYDSAQSALDLAYAVRSAYTEALRAQDERQLAADSLATAQTIEKTAETQLQAGDVPRSNVVRSQIEVTRAEQALSVADTDLANRYATLRSLLGLGENAPIELTDELTYTPATYRLADLQALALKNRPDLRSAQLLRNAREASVHEARAASQPDLVLEGRRASLDPNTPGETARALLVFPLFDLGRSRAGSRAAEGALREQEAALAEAKRAALLDVETSYRNLLQAQKTVESFQAGRLTRSKELLDMAQTGYQNGANTLLELLDAQSVYRNEQAEYARALAAYATARAALERAVGGRLP